MIDRVDYMRIDGDKGEGVRVIFTYDDKSIDTMEFWNEDKEEVLPMLMMPGTPEILMIRLRSILRLTVH